MSRIRSGKRSWLLLALGVIATAVALPLVKDIILEEWYIGRLGSEDVLERAEAIQGLGAMGSSRAAPYLCAILEEAPNGWTGDAPISSIDFIDLEADEIVIGEPDPADDVDLAHEALKALQQIRAPAEVALPSILRSVEVGNLGVVLNGCFSGVSSGTADAECVVALADLASRRLDLLSRTVRSGSRDAALVAALAVGRLAPKTDGAEEAVAALLVRAGDGDEGLRNAVAWALGQIGPEVFPD